ncbi:unnamed protein product, partial [Polarella glacialis]
WLRWRQPRQLGQQRSGPWWRMPLFQKQTLPLSLKVLSGCCASTGRCTASEDATPWNFGTPAPGVLGILMLVPPRRAAKHRGRRKLRRSHSLASSLSSWSCILD